jgi:hypothetical protein
MENAADPTRQNALGSRDEARSLGPGDAEAHNSRGSVPIVLQRPQEASPVALEASRAAPINIPVSAGEFFDKLAILEIKEKRLADPEKLRHVAHELSLLRAVAAEQPPQGDDLRQRIAELKRVNEEIWDVEDALRRCEARGEFGAAFVELARAVYRNNDRRAAIKKEISLRHGSGVVEEKSHEI